MLTDRWLLNKGRRGWMLAALLLCACGPPAAAPEPTKLKGSPGDRADQLRATYARWVLQGPPQDCSVYLQDCAESFAREAGFDPADPAAPNPKTLLENPDKVWLTGWERLPSSAGERHKVFLALSYAAVLRNFTERCRSDFDTIDLQRAEENRRLENELQAIDKIENSYARLVRLVTYRKLQKRRFAEAVGPRYDLELAIFERFKKAERESLYHLQEQRAADAGQLRPAMAFEDERDAYCLGLGTPSFQDKENVPIDSVLIPIGDARRKQLKDAVRKARDLEDRLPLKPMAYPELNERASPEKGSRVLVRKEALGVALKVSEVTETPDGKLVVTLLGKSDEKDARFDCKPTQKVDRVVDGKVIYEEECQKRDELKDIRVVLRIAERPDAVIRQGDRLAVIGDVLSAELMTAASPAFTVNAKLEIEVTHVLEIWRETLLLADYFLEW